MSNNPFDINWAALSVFRKTPVTCAVCEHDFMSRSKTQSVDGEELLVAETPCPMCGAVECVADKAKGKGA